MTYVVLDTCIKCKFTDCVEVRPVDCFYEGETMLVINPDECIDCGVCEPECPVDAIKSDTEPGLEQWLELNREYSSQWPNITVKKLTPRMRASTSKKPESSRNTSPPTPALATETSAPCHRGLALDGRRDFRAICGRQAFARAGLFRVGGARGSRCGEFKKSRRAV